jgi:hypothetical protein
MSLSGRPGNAGSRLHNHLYDALGLDYVYIYDDRSARRDWGHPCAGIQWRCNFDAVQEAVIPCSIGSIRPLPDRKRQHHRQR